MTNQDRNILHIALPSIVSNVTIPLLGLADTAITGHLGAAVYMAAIAVGSTIFSNSYWLFSFLRTGTGGITAQAYGRGDMEACRDCLRKALTIAMAIAVAFLVLQTLIADLTLWLIDGTSEVKVLARAYFNILIWGAPAQLVMTVLNGWFIGMQNARAPMYIAIGQNVLNILCSCLFVFGLGWKVEGVAWGTLIAQWGGVTAACLMSVRLPDSPTGTTSILREALHPSAAARTTAQAHRVSWRKLFSINTDIFLRTLCIVCTMFSFTAFGALQGDIILSVNTLLMQIYLFISYFLDGYAYAGEAIGGKLYGAGNIPSLRLLERRLFLWGFITAGAFTLLSLFGYEAFVALLTDNIEVRTAAQSFQWVPIVIPFVSLGAFIYDGLFIGTTLTRGMLLSTFTAALLYFILALITPTNHILWTAFLLYLGTRGLVQYVIWRKHFPANHS